MDVPALMNILSDYNTSQIKQQLLLAPQLIRAQKNRVAEARQAFKDAELAKAEIDAEMTADIAAEVNDKGKPIFSNAEARQAELLRRRSQNPEYLAAVKTCKEAEWAFNEAQSDLERLYDEFKAYRYVADITARELALLAAGLKSGADQEQEEARDNNREPF